jgi:Transposase DDE domain group 1
MPLKLEHTDERLTRRAGLVLVDRFGKQLNLAAKLDRAFPTPGSNRGRRASDYVLTLTEMLIDGAMHLEDVRAFEDDDAYKQMTERDAYPSSDAIGDWLRRTGTDRGEQRLWSVLRELIEHTARGTDLTLDIDGTIIEADKGDATWTYKDVRGYHPLLGACTDLGLFVGSRFQQGSASPQAELVDFVHECVAHLSGRIKTVRSDSAGYNHHLINDCFAHHRRFTITADHDAAVMRSLATIPKKAWKHGRSHDGTKADYDVAETLHMMDASLQEFRLVIKRTERVSQRDLFDGNYHYWIIATNIPAAEMDAQALLNFHNARGEMERLIGELKHHYNMDHLPCGQFHANALYFTIGILAFTLVQLLKRHYFGDDWVRRSVRSLRYHWLHLPARLVSHARYTVARIAMSYDLFQHLLRIYTQLCLAPAPA